MLPSPAVAIVTVVTWFIDIVGPALDLPDTVQALALSVHYGQPMLGQWDGAGIVASLLLAVGGVSSARHRATSRLTARGSLPRSKPL